MVKSGPDTMLLCSEYKSSICSWLTSSLLILEVNYIFSKNI